MDPGFDAFVEVETPRLLRVAYALSGNPHDAWDLVQEALVRVGQRWDRLVDGNPGGYAHTTLVRLNIDRGRRQARERLVDEPPDRPAAVQIAGPIDETLMEALRQLPTKQRSAVVLRAVDDLDHEAIAERMGCSVGTARSNLSRGLATLRDLLAVVDQEARP